MSRVIAYLESIHVQEGSALSRFFEYMLGEKGKNMSLVDGFMALLSVTGLSTLQSNPKLGIPLIITGTSSMTYRRGPEAGFIVPVAVYTTIQRPDLAVAVVREGAETLGEAARGTIQLGFQVTGLIVTAAGAVVGYVFANKKKATNKIE